MKAVGERSRGGGTIDSQEATSLFVWNDIVDGFAIFEDLLHLDEEVDAVDEELDQLDFREAETIRVGDVKGAANSRSVDSTRSALLQAEVLEDLKEKEME